MTGADQCFACGGWRGPNDNGMPHACIQSQGVTPPHLTDIQGTTPDYLTQQELEKINELRNLKYKGAIKNYIKAFVSLKQMDDIGIEAVTNNIYEETLDIMKARERGLLFQHSVREDIVRTVLDINREPHLFIGRSGANKHEPKLCPECIEPGSLAELTKLKEGEDG